MHKAPRWGGRRTSRSVVIAGVLALIATACSGSSPPGKIVPGPTQPPNTDRFYRAPSDLHSLAHGTLIRSRGAAIADFDVPSVATTRTLLFASTDIHGRPIAAAETVFTPRKAWSGPGTRPLLAVQVPYDSLGAACAPSYVFQINGTQANLNLKVIRNVMRLGWEVVVSDYEGPQSLFGIGPQEGRIVLDGISAAEADKVGGTSAQTPVGLWGYSGGGQASAWGAELAPRYAPSLHIIGVAEGGVPADMKAVLETIDGGPNAVIEPMVLTAIARAYPKAGVLAALNQAGRTAFKAVSNVCGGNQTIIQQLANTRIDALTAQPGLINTPRLTAIFAALRLGQHAPTAPIYSYHAIQDTLTPYAPVQHLVAYYCSRGTTVDAVAIPGDHYIVAASGTIGAFEWLNDRFAGKPSPDTC
jgi:pimeloyl-ACP methyl ester carboxylesterase